MKTADLRDKRKEEITMNDDSEQQARSRHMLNQFNQIKKILMNFSFKDKNKQILSTDII